MRVRWMDFAVCAQVGFEMFFPKRGASTKAAKKLCGSCDVRAQCLAYALANGVVDGIWGGLSGVERERLRKGTAA